MVQLLDGLWYHIPDFNGYLIDKYGVVKSEKFQYAHPEGLFIKYNHSDGNYYILTDIKNRRKRRSKEQLLNAVRNGNGYCQEDNEVFMGGRNRGWQNYDKYHPNDAGTVSLNVGGMPTIIPKVTPNKDPENVKLEFNSFKKYLDGKKEPEQMVWFY